MLVRVHLLASTIHVVSVLTTICLSVIISDRVMAYIRDLVTNNEFSLLHDLVTII